MIHPTDAISILIALLSLAIAIATLQQNKKMIEDANRPYIVFRTVTTFFQDIQIVFMIKNYGKTAAIITDFKTSPDISVYSAKSKNIPPFNQIIGSLLAPGQSQICHINKNAVLEYPSIEVEISYKTSQQNYKDYFIINLAGEMDNFLSHASSKGSELKTISFTLQDFVERQL